MSDVRLLYPTNYLSAPELKGEDRTLTIRDVRLETIETDRGNDEVVIMRFEETYKQSAKSGKKERQFILNKTNMRTIVSLYGVDHEKDWPGKRITLFPTQCAGKGGEIVDCIRIRPVAPEKPKKEAS